MVTAVEVRYTTTSTANPWANMQAAVAAYNVSVDDPKTWEAHMLHASHKKPFERSFQCG